jgi:mRNA interferase RelE/StbE
MKIQIDYSKQATKFLLKNQNTVSENLIEANIVKAIKKILKIEASSIDLKKLKGNLKGFYRIRIGKVRVIFSISAKKLIIVFIRIIDVRGNVY